MAIMALRPDSLSLQKTTCSWSSISIWLKMLIAAIPSKAIAHGKYVFVSSAAAQLYPKLVKIARFADTAEIPV